MDKKAKDLLELHSYIEGVDKEVTMLLQSLQWDRKHLLEGSTLVPCRYDAAHKVPPDKKELHEKECFLRCEGYTKEDVLLPDPLNPKASTVVQLNKEDIQKIINNAAQADPSFRRGAGCGAAGCEPLTAERLQASYSADERRAIYDVVVSSAPDFEDIDLASAEIKQERRRKSKLEVLAELRDMRRRRAKYRRAGADAANKNYSNVLRGLIKTQMELYTGASVDSAPQHPNTSRQTSTSHDNTIHIKQEPISDEESEHTQYSKRDEHRRRHREQDNYRRDRYYTDRNHRDTETNEYREDRDRHRHGRTYASSWEDVDGKERRKRSESNRQEFKEKRRPSNKHYETHSKTNDRYVHDRDGRREEPTDKRHSKDYDKGHAKFKARKEYSEDSSSRDTQTSRKRKHSDDNDSREPRHIRTKYRERSRSKTREREAKADSHKKTEDIYYVRGDFV